MSLESSMQDTRIQRVPLEAEAGSRLGGLLAGLALIGLGIVLPLVLIELCFRLLASAPPKTKPHADRPIFYYRPAGAPDMGDFAYPPAKADGVFRIEVVGDSISFGPNMQFDDTFSKRLERMMNLGDVRMTEVINRGVSGFSSSDELNIVKNAVIEKADLVLLQVTLNDPEIEPLNLKHERNTKRFAPYAPPEWLKGVLAYWRSLGFILARLHNAETRRAYQSYFVDLFENPATWGQFESSIRAMSRVTQENGVKFVVAVFPLFGFELDKDYPFHPLHAKIAALLEELKVPYLDLFQAFENLPLSRLEVIPGVDRHPNEIAHRMAAERMYRWLVSLGLLPESARIPALYAARIDRKERRVSEQWMIKRGERRISAPPR